MPVHGSLIARPGRKEIAQMSSATLAITIKAASLLVMASGAIVALSAHPATGRAIQFMKS